MLARSIAATRVHFPANCGVSGESTHLDGLSSAARRFACYTTQENAVPAAKYRPHEFRSLADPAETPQAGNTAPHEILFRARVAASLRLSPQPPPRRHEITPRRPAVALRPPVQIAATSPACST